MTDLLRGVPLFADSAEGELTHLADLAEEVSVEEGHHLVREGHRRDRFILVLEGTADVLVGDSRVRTLSSGDFLGEIAMVLGGRTTATVVATSQVRALSLPSSGFQRVLERSPGLRARVEHQAWERLSEPLTAPGPDLSAEPTEGAVQP